MMVRPPLRLLVFVLGAILLTPPLHAQPAPAVPASPPAAREALVTNVFMENDLKQALLDIAAQTGVTIIPDSTVQGTVTADFKGVPLEKALGQLLLTGGYAWVKINDCYLVGEPDPSNPNFPLLCASEIVRLRYCQPQTMIAILGKLYGRYLSTDESAPAIVTSSSGSGGNDGQRERSGSQRVNTPTTIGASAGVTDYTIMITAPRYMIDRIKQDIQLIDRAPAQVMLEAAVVEVSSEALKNIGVDWATRWLSGSTNNAGSNLLYSAIENSKLVAITALLTKGEAILRANPRVATKEGQTAELEVGRENYFAILTGPVTYPYTTLEQIKSGIFLRITPRVIDGTDEIDVFVEPEIRDVTGIGKNDLPEITLRRATTTIQVKAGQSIVIGGLINESTLRTVSRIPLLGDLPLIGKLFQRVNSQRVKNEIVIIVTPRLLTGEQPLPAFAIQQPAPGKK
jgi:type IV pilus assembly protein PilQ